MPWLPSRSETKAICWRSFSGAMVGIGPETALAGWPAPQPPSSPVITAIRAKLVLLVCISGHLVIEVPTFAGSNGIRRAFARREDQGRARRLAEIEGREHIVGVGVAVGHGGQP